MQQEASNWELCREDYLCGGSGANLQHYFGRAGGRALARHPHKRPITPRGVLRPAVCDASATHEGLGASSRGHLPREKNNVTGKSPVGGISVVTLIRTDATLDYGQKG